jgi:hypothetical protein
VLQCSTRIPRRGRDAEIGAAAAPGFRIPAAGNCWATFCLKVKRLDASIARSQSCESVECGEGGVRATLLLRVDTLRKGSTSPRRAPGKLLALGRGAVAGGACNRVQAISTFSRCS